MKTTREGLGLMEVMVAVAVLALALPAFLGAIFGMQAGAKSDATGLAVRNFAGELMAAVAEEPERLSEGLPEQGRELDLAGVLRLLSARELPADVHQTLEKARLTVHLQARVRSLEPGVEGGPEFTGWIVKIAWTSGGRPVSQTLTRLTAKES